MAAMSAVLEIVAAYSPRRKIGHSVGSAAQKPPYLLEFLAITGFKIRWKPLAIQLCESPLTNVLSYEGPEEPPDWVLRTRQLTLSRKRASRGLIHSRLGHGKTVKRASVSGMLTSRVFQVPLFAQAQIVITQAWSDNLQGFCRAVAEQKNAGSILPAPSAPSPADPVDRARSTPASSAA
jgi:hypothetical protein